MKQAILVPTSEEQVLLYAQYLITHGRGDEAMITYISTTANAGDQVTLMPWGYVALVQQTPRPPGRLYIQLSARTWADLLKNKP